MNTENNLKNLAHEYKSIKAPEETKIMAEKILSENNTVEAKKKPFGFLKQFTAIAACLVLMFTACLNISPVFAATVKEVPIIEKLAKLLIFRKYEDVSEDHDMKIDSAKVEGLKNKELMNSINGKYEKEAKELYEGFMKKLDGGLDKISLSSTYSVKSDNGTTMSIEHSIFEAAASGYNRLEYDTIDTKNEIYITLPSIFVDNSYVKVISAEIKDQIKEQMAGDDGRVYFTDEDAFKSIDENQQFYINDNHKLVITFDEYEIAPGYMGTVEFEIPTESIANILEGNDYIK